MGPAYSNRAGRRSGGERPKEIPVRRGGLGEPLASIQCFERRHAECRGSCEPISREACACKCHEPKEPIDAGDSDV